MVRSKIILRRDLGQNFLINREVAKNLVEVARIGINDIVLEVGSGAGIVTQYLVNNAKKLITVEIDKRFTKLLKSRFKDYKNIEIVENDILKISANKYGLKRYGYKLVGSLPYNISKQIIKKFIEIENCPSEITVIIQKEVAENYTAKIPRSSFLSNYIRLFGEATFIDTVSRKEFNPIPKVDGAILHIKLIKQKDAIKEKFIKFLKSSFQNPRKKLINNLSSIYYIKKSKINKLFNEIGIEINARASNLKLSQWRKLYKRIQAS